jgi:hypothetical protein
MTPKSNAEGMWGAPALPLPASMNREVLKWLQSLDLSHSVRNIRRCVASPLSRPSTREEAPRRPRIPRSAHPPQRTAMRS